MSSERSWWRGKMRTRTLTPFLPASEAAVRVNLAVVGGGRSGVGLSLMSTGEKTKMHEPRGWHLRL